MMHSFRKTEVYQTSYQVKEHHDGSHHKDLG